MRKGCVSSYFIFEYNSLTLLMSDRNDEMYDEVITDIHDLEKSLDADLQKFEKTLGSRYVSTDV